MVIGLQSSKGRSYVNALPFRDWLAHIERRLTHRTGVPFLTNTAPESYWLSLYHVGEGWVSACDDFLFDYRQTN